MAPAPTCLLPGYTQVTSFGADDEYLSEEEEVVYVTLDLGPIEPTLVPNSSTYRLIGLDTPTPFLQLSGTILKGEHKPLLGSELLFTETPSTADAPKCVTHLGITSERVRFAPVTLLEKSDSSVPPLFATPLARSGARPLAPMPPLAPAPAPYASMGIHSGGGPGGPRGRPKGQKKLAQEQRVLSQSVDQMVGSAALPDPGSRRRGGGRKKKAVVDEEASTGGEAPADVQDANSASSNPKKKRGRPRKQTTLLEGQGEQEQPTAGPSTAPPEDAPLRRSGRQRKVVERPEFAWDDGEDVGELGALAEDPEAEEGEDYEEVPMEVDES